MVFFETNKKNESNLVSRYFKCTHQSSFWFDKWPILAVHFVIQSTGVAKVVTSAVSSPQWRAGGTTIYTLSALCENKQKCQALQKVELTFVLRQSGTISRHE